MYKHRWQPSKTQKREFAEKMNNDPEYAQAYYERKQTREDKRRSSSQFNYSTAGGRYVPTQMQQNNAFHLLESVQLTPEQETACNIVISGYSCQNKVNHDYIHIVNELSRTHLDY
jgi:hypothetical protein